MVEPLVTTVIPTFRRPILLGRAIKSVLSQTFRDFVIYVYDNASGDETEATVKELAERDDRIFYFKNCQNIGAVANIFQGLKSVTTPYYSLLSDDDFLLPNFYEEAVKAYKSFPKAKFVCSKTIVIDLIKKKMQFRNQDWEAGFYEPTCENILKMSSSHFVSTGILLSRNAREKIGIFDPSGSDTLYVTMAAAAVPFVVLDSYGAVLTLHENAYSMVEEGIVKEDTLTLYRYLLATVENVMRLEISDERKVCLLMLIIYSYQQVFDYKKLNFFLGKHNPDKIKNIIDLPTSITSRGLAAKIFGIAPKKFRPSIGYMYKAIDYIRRKKIERKSKDWSALPAEAYAVMLDPDANISELNFCLNRIK